MATRVAGGRWWRWREPGIRGHQAAAGWLFLAPVILILGVFLVVPIVMAAWVSVSDWNGNGSPFGPNAHYVGLAELPPSADDARTRSEQLRHVDPQQRLLRRPRRSDPDCGCALPGRARQQAREGGRLLPNRVLFPVGHELGRDHGPLPLPLFADRRDQQAPVVLRRNRAGLVLRPARPLPRHPRPVRRPAVELAREPVLPRRELLGLAGRPEHRDVRLHHHGGVHDVGNVHADLPRGAPAHRRVGERGGGARRCDRVEEVPSTSRCR